MTDHKWRWPSFSPHEIACRHCGAVRVDEAALGALQRLRDILGRPVILTSAYRCPAHNAMIGGAPLSAHKLGIAFDISLNGHDRHAVLAAAQQAGFGSFGLYQTFLHVDTRQGRKWFGAGGEQTWNG